MLQPIYCIITEKKKIVSKRHKISKNGLLMIKQLIY